MKEKAYFCPACGAPTVDTAELQERASCRSCDWSGPLAEAPVHYFEHQQLDPIKAFSQEVSELLAKQLALPLGRSLIRWGFLDHADTRLLAVYLKAAATGMIRALLQVHAERKGDKHVG